MNEFDFFSGAADISSFFDKRQLDTDVYKALPLDQRTALRKQKEAEVQSAIEQYSGQEPGVSKNSKAYRAWKVQSDKIQQDLTAEFEAQYPVIKDRTGYEKLKDVGLSFVQGAAGLAENAATLGGYDNSLRVSLGDANKALQAAKSDESQRISANSQRRSKANEDAGFFQQFKSGWQNFTDNPLENLSGGLGSLAPVLLTGGAGLALRGAALGGEIAAGIGATTFAAAGAGATKQERGDKVYQEAKALGYSEKAAMDLATRAAQTDADTIGRDIAGGVIGAAESFIGAGGAVTKMMMGAKQGVRAAEQGMFKAAGKAAASETTQETFQNVNDATGANVRAQQLGFDAPTFQGVGIKLGESLPSAFALGGVTGAGGSFRNGAPSIQSPDFASIDTESFNAAMQSAPTSKGARQRVADKVSQAIATGTAPATDSTEGKIYAKYVETLAAKPPTTTTTEGNQNDNSGADSGTLGDGGKNVRTVEPFRPTGDVDVLGQLLAQAADANPNSPRADATSQQPAINAATNATAGSTTNTGDSSTSSAAGIAELAANAAGQTELSDNGGATNQAPKSITDIAVAIATSSTNEPSRPDNVSSTGISNDSATGGNSQSAGSVDPIPIAPSLTRAATVQQTDIGLVLQNRNRSTPASIAQMTEISAKPDFLRAGISNDMQTGAPVVFSNNDAPVSGTVLGDTETIVDGKGNRYESQYAVIESDQLLPSHSADGLINTDYATGKANTLRQDAIDLVRSNLEQSGMFEPATPPTRQSLFEALQNGNSTTASTNAAATKAAQQRSQPSAGKLDDGGDDQAAADTGTTGDASGNVASIGTSQEVNAKILFSKAAADPVDLIVQHNLSSENLLFALRMGGLPVPSLAITKASTPSLSFGDITLLGNKELANPKGYKKTKVFGADIYSPRYPDISYKPDAGVTAKLNAKLAPFAKSARSLTDIRSVDDLAQNKAFQAYAEQNGKSSNWSELKFAAGKLLQDAGAEERLFLGYTNQGNRKYKAHTLDNVVSILKKELRGGESFNYGVGSLRAKFTPQFRSVADIKLNAKRLVNKQEFEAIKKEIDNDFIALAQVIAPNKSLETVIDILADAPRMGLVASAKDLGVTLSDDAKTQAVAFLERLKNLPTEYFEAKILAEVSLDSFDVAVVKQSTDKAVVDALKAQGINVVTYTNDADRAATIERAAKENNLVFSQSGNQNTGNTPTKITAAIDARMGSGALSRMKDVQIVATASDLPKGALPSLSSYTKAEVLAMQERAANDAKLEAQRMVGVQSSGFTLQQQEQAKPQAATDDMFGFTADDYANAKPLILKNKPVNDAQTSLFSQIGDQAQAYFNPTTGKIVLIADRIKPGQEMAVLLHEIGHKRLQQAIGTLGMKRLINAVTAWKNAPDGSNERKVFDAADARAKKSGAYDTEFLTYSIEEAELLGLSPDTKASPGTVERWLALVKDLFGKAIKRLMSDKAVPDLTVADLSAIARGAAALELTDAPMKLASDGQIIATSNLDQDAAIVAQYATESGAPSQAAIREAQDQIRAVKAQYAMELADGTWRNITPTGKPSELTQGQWIQVRTPNFKNWFGAWDTDPASASKVVNETTGEPLVVYHGTDKLFTKFDSSFTQDSVFWFTSNLQSIVNGEVGASAKGEIVAVFLKINTTAGYKETDNFFQDQLISKGFDGYKFDDVFVAFDSTQIKSATGNIGTFSANPDIRFSLTTSKNDTALNAGLKQTAGNANLFKPKETSTFAKTNDAFVENFIDYQRPISKWLEATFGNAENHPIWQGLKTIPTKFAAINDRFVNTWKNPLDKKIKAIADRAGNSYEATAAAVGQYATLAHVAERNAYLRSKGLTTNAGGYTDAQAASGMAYLENKLDPVLLKEAQQMLVKANTSLLDEMIKAKQVTPSEAQYYRTQFKNYVPMTMEQTKEDPFTQLERGDQFSAGINAQVIKATKGYSKGNADNAYTATMARAARVNIRVASADFKEAIILAQPASQGEIEVTRKAPTSEDPKGLNYRDASGNWYTLKFKTESLQDAVYKRNVEEITDPVLKMLAIPTRFIARSVTQFILAFSPVNTVRDVVEKAIIIRGRKYLDAAGQPIDAKALSRSMAGYSIDPNVWTAAGYLASKTTPANPTPTFLAMRDMIDLGGLSTWGNHLARSNEEAAKELKKLGGTSKLVAGLSHAVETYATTFELISSASSYLAMRDANVEPKAASFHTLDLMNFKNKGARTGFIRALYMFSNPALQGFNNVRRQFVNSDGSYNKQGGYDAAILFSTSMALYGMLSLLAGGDDDDKIVGNKMDRRGSGEVSSSIPMVFGETVIKTPLAYGLFRLMWTGSSAIIRSINGVYTPVEAAGEILKSMAREAIPIGYSEVPIMRDPLYWFMNTVTPSLLRPALEVAVDKTPFGGSLTKKFKVDDKFKSEQPKKATEQVWVDMAGRARQVVGIDASPEVWRTLVLGYTAGPVAESIKAAMAMSKQEKELRGIPTSLQDDLRMLQPLGMTRVIAGADRSIEAKYYEELGDKTKLLAQVNVDMGDKPKSKTGEARADVLKRIAKSSLNDLEKKEAIATYDEIKRIRTDGAAKTRSLKKPGLSTDKVMDINRQFASESIDAQREYLNTLKAAQ